MGSVPTHDPEELVEKRRPRLERGMSWPMCEYEIALCWRATQLNHARAILMSVWPRLSWWRRAIGVLSLNSPPMLERRAKRLVKTATRHFRLHSGVQDFLDADTRRDPWVWRSQHREA